MLFYMLDENVLQDVETASCVATQEFPNMLWNPNIRPYHQPNQSNPYSIIIQQTTE
jgi:hypothetical protein